SERLTLGVLRSTTCLVQTSLLTLNCTCVTGQQASLLQGSAVSWVVNVQCTGNSQTQCAGLTGWATAVDGNLHVELAFTVQQGQWQQDVLLVQLVREVVVQATAIDDDFTGTRDHAYASNCALTTTNGLDWALVQDWSFSFGLSGCLWSDRITNGVGEFFGSSSRSSDVSSVSYVVLEVLVISHYCATCLSSKVRSDHAYASNCALTTTNGLDWALVQDWSFSFGLSGCLWSDRITNGVGEFFGSSSRSSDVSSVSYVVLEVLVISHYCATCLSSKV